MSSEQSVERFDVIVCGGGWAGLCAALTATQDGASVLLIEKAPRLGGSTRLSGGSVWTWANLEAMQRAIPGGNPVLQQLVHSRLDADRTWLAEQGLRLSPEKVFQANGRGQSIEPEQAIGQLADQFKQSGGTILLNSALDSLVVAEGGVVGVRVAQPEGVVQFRSAAVILATGGFQGNAELVARYIVPTPDNLYLRANPWSTGDAFIAATAIGAAASPGLDGFFGHALLAPPAHFDEHHFSEVSQYYGKFSVALNMRGQRFTDESEGTGEEVLNQSLARQPGGLAFFVVDEEIMGLSYTADRVTRAIIERAKRFDAVIVVADTISELAAELASHGLPPAGVVETIEVYNVAIADGRTDSLLPPRRRWHYPLVHPPFTAVKAKAGITQTTGGLAVDEQMRVLRRSASSSPMAQSISSVDEYRTTPIRGLYAAGGDVGNIAHIGYMGNLGAGVVTGRIAGSGAASLAAAGRHAGPA